jgi:hypothetical protein
VAAQQGGWRLPPSLSPMLPDRVGPCYS